MNLLDSTLATSGIKAAAARISPYVRRTPVLFVDGADFGLSEVRLALKLEFTQHAESFKARGAFNHMLSREVPAAGVVAASGGNHGAAVAFAALDQAPTLTHALRHGGPVDAPAGGVAADSLAPRRVGQLVYPIARKYVKETVVVSDEAIVAAQSALWRTLRIVVEPGGAAAFAALHSGAWAARPNSTVGVLLCGANTTAVRFD